MTLNLVGYIHGQNIDNTPFNITLPGGTVAGDLCVGAQVAFVSDSVLPTGFTQIDTKVASDSGEVASWYKVLTGTDITNGFVTMPGTPSFNLAQYALWVFHSTNGTPTVDGHSVRQANDGLNPTVYNSGTITTANANDIVCVVLGGRGGSGQTAWSSTPGGVTIDQNSPTQTMHNIEWHYTFAGPGATSDQTASLDCQSDREHAAVIGVADAPLLGGGPLSPFKTAPDARTWRRLSYRIVDPGNIATPPPPVFGQRPFLIGPDFRSRQRARYLIVDPTGQIAPPVPAAQQPQPFLVAPDAATRRRFGQPAYILQDPTGQIASLTPVTAQQPFLIAPDAQTRRRFNRPAYLLIDPTGQVAPLMPVAPQRPFLTAPDAATRRRSGLPAPPLLGDPVGPAGAVTGTIAVTLGAFVMAASGGSGPSGSMAVTLAPFVMAATGSTVTGTIAATLDAFTMTATGTTGDVVAQGGGRYPTVHRHLETTWTFGKLTHETWVIDQPQDRKRRNLIALIVLGVI